ncbi:hypothetical protein AQUCO_02200214v1 [Aquilegia coerulea]|uniref:F-box domain-containing protein n=1 Tax=Aquilegia coerulea TaxID=218851 RepID=A0A2G5DDS9_AQUCA|nr:hypothetical protein AQUCO_02200214v1 [Aquilegia coerulea]
MMRIVKRQRLVTTVESNKKMNHHHELPEEIMHDILSRLPAESLYQCCRFVSKDWFNLIKDPDFINLHLSRINNKHASSNGLIALCHKKNQFFNLLDENNHPTPTPTTSISFKALKIHLDLPLLSQSQTIKIVGSANGLMCLSILPQDDLFYICNPVTGEILQLPIAPGIAPYCENYNLELVYPSSSGFGFHAATNTYKIVRTWFFRVKGSVGLIKTGIEIYNVASGVWRWIDQLVISKIMCHMNVSLLFLNEALHWQINYTYDQSYIGVIGIGDETFTTFENPIVDYEIESRGLCSLRQCLCLIHKRYDKHIVVWIMKQYGMVQSWTKERVISRQMFGSIKTLSFYPLNTMKNEIVIVDSSGDYQGYYDIEKQEVKEILIHGTHSSRWDSQIVPHVGSLISPRSIACTNDIHQVSSAKSRKPIRFRLKKNVKKPP